MGTTLAGTLLLGLIFDILKFENCKSLIRLYAYYQSVILRVAILLLVELLQASLASQRKSA